MQLKIRPINDQDNLDQITEWFGTIGREWLAAYESGAGTRPANRKKIERWMHGSDGKSTILAAVDSDSDQVIGFAVCLLHDDPNTDETYGAINGIYVDDEHRNQHVGRKLKEAADEWCRHAGASYMRAYIGIGNKAMLRVCKLLGYEPWMVTWVRKFD